MEYSCLVESIVEGLLKDATSMFSPEEIKYVGGPSFNSRERLVSLPIDHFLQLATELKKGENPDKKERVEKAINSGSKFYEPPHLSIDLEGEIAKVVGHEGRHRANALLRRGFTHMPVKLKVHDSPNGTIRWSREADPDHGNVKVWPTQLVGQDKRITLPFPVKREEAHLPYKVPVEIEEAVTGFINDLIEANIDILHATPSSRLGSIAKKGLVPAETEPEAQHVYPEFYQARSKGKIYGVPAGQGKDYSLGHEQWTKDVARESKSPVVSLRVKSKDHPHFVDDYYSGEPASVQTTPYNRLFGTDPYTNGINFKNPHEVTTNKKIDPEKIDFYHQDTGWTPLSAHEPELFNKIDSRKLDITKQAPKGQMSLFPLELYTETVNNIVDSLLTEIIKANLGFGEPVSKNIRSGALFGDIIKKARAEGERLGLRGVSGLNVVPTGGAGASIAPPIDTETYSGEVKTLPPAIYAGLPSKRTGGVAAARQAVVHEVGHLLNQDLEPQPEYKVRPSPKKEQKIPMSPQQRLEREVKAVATEREFAGRHGIEINPEQDQRNLNTYRRGIMRPVPLSPEEQRKAHAQQDIDTDETIAILQKKYTVPSEIEKPDFSASRAVSGKDIYADTYTHRTHELLRFKGN